MKELSVVITVMNEEENIKPLLEAVRSALNGIDYEVILVDDGSVDKTKQKVLEHGDERTILVELRKNYGQSTAMTAGIDYSRGKYVALLDGDLQNDPKDIPALVKKLDDGFDLACGYRAKRKDTTFKRLQSRIANFVRSRFVGDGVRDTGCTLKAMKRECREALLPFNGMHRFIPALIASMGWRVTEMAVNHRPRVAGVSKYGFGNRALRATMDMFGVRWLNSRRVRYQVK